MIQVLDSKTIDKIAAGEVIERPASIVKELLENAVDAGATRISVDIKNGGIDEIRVSDNGSGIERKEVRTAFLPHATSKLRSIEDLFILKSLGFRGEALPSIASVSRVKLFTKTEGDNVGIKYVIEGGTELSFEEAGVPDGSTFIVNDLFFNTPARRKFLKSANTEAGHISTLVEETALSNPDISIKYSISGSNRLYTSGNGDLKEVIYRIFGREISESLLPLKASSGDMILTGFISKPIIARSSRAMENYFVNSRYVKDNIISKAIEDGYAGFLMQHKFPFTVLMLQLPSENVDINVHPRKMEIKLSDGSAVYEFIRKAVRDTLSNREFINDFDFEKEKSPKERDTEAPAKAPEPFEAVNAVTYTENSEKPLSLFKEETVYDAGTSAQIIPKKREDERPSPVSPDTIDGTEAAPLEKPFFDDGVKGSQLDLFEEKILSRDASKEFKIVGQIFETYWIIEFRDEMLLIDQHAAHEKVNYESFLKQFRVRSVITQNLNPPIVMTLSGEQRSVLNRFLPRFTEMGFEIEPFGGNDFAIRTVPYNLYGLNDSEVMTALLDELSAGIRDEDISIIHDKIASMSCKAAIKGNTAISLNEAEALIEQLLSCKDPYNCPHGRPTIIKMSKKELEKKFKRVL
ncbi:MAG: DNA mismatch repair endonuclease MutL [Lachnospiraceae bacterium]|nr:DNA mismatch repair endonuclease MutL [Lachnospiraceae bacterium]